MAYKNLFLRTFLSIIFILIYLSCLIINFNLVYYLIFLIYFLVFFEIFLYFKKYKILPMVYLIISLVFFLTIDFDNEIILGFNLFIFTVITFDIFSYICGKTFGKNKITKISPNKTLEGFFGGLSFSLFSSLLFAYYFDYHINFRIISFILLIIIFAFIGDLIESFFKRKNDLKNSSEFIPGHGGVFDRFDSFLFSIIIYSVSISI